MHIALLLALLASSGLVSAVGPVSILRTGLFHGDEVPDAAAGEWLALLAGSDGIRLQSVVVSIAPEHDVILDEAGEQTGKRVVVDGAVEALILVRGLPAPRDGALLPSALVQRTLDADETIRVTLGSIPYAISMRCSGAPPLDGTRRETCDLRLASGPLEQSLSGYSSYFEGTARWWSADQPPSVIWAGDLDSDGRLDLLLDTTDHYNVWEIRLYLSSAAGPGRLVAESAVFRSVGC